MLCEWADENMQGIPSTAFTTTCDCSAVMGHIWKQGLRGALTPQVGGLAPGWPKKAKRNCLLIQRHQIFVCPHHHAMGSKWQDFFVHIMNMKISRLKIYIWTSKYPDAVWWVCSRDLEIGPPFNSSCCYIWTSGP